MGKGSARTLQHWLDLGYTKIEAERMRRSRIPGTLEYFTIFKGMTLDDATIALGQYNKKSASTLKNMVIKYGEIEGIKRWNIYREKQAISNSFEYKRDKYGWTREQFDEFNKSRGSIGENNGNYGLGYYNVWVEKFGKEKANEMNKALSPLKAKGGQSQKGKPKSAKARKNMSKSAIKRIKEQGSFIAYNPNSIPIIEAYGKDNGYSFQHAENGGEYLVPDVYYYVDGYDVKNNVVIEYDEAFHVKQIEKDMLRQQHIMDVLGCKFIRIQETGEVNIYEN